MTTPIEGLYQARALIEQGWTQGRMAHRSRMRPWTPTLYCAVGAINQAFCGTPYPEMFPLPEEARMAKQQLSEAIDLPLSIECWNDTRRTKAEVLAGFDKAIAKLASERQLVGV